MKYELPKVRIKYSFLVYNNFSKLRAEKENVTLPSEEKVIETVKRYQEAWAKLEETILSGMSECFELEFYHPVIDAYVAPRIIPQSHPLLLNTRHEPDQFVDVLTHELFHILLDDNKTYNNLEKLDEVWDRLYPGENDKVRNHIWVHAGLKYIYLDVLDKEYRLDRDKEDHKNRPDYLRAWEIVEQEGHRKPINSFKACYVELSETQG